MNRISHLMTDTITISSESGVDVNGDPTFGSQTTIKGRVENKNKIIKMIDGNEEISSHVFVTLSAVTMGTRVWLPGTNTAVANDSLRPLIIKKANSITGNGTLYEVWL